ncbi:MAG TPA: MauE/DoxX family redox-associated membrane protein [Candidatus Limnocylindrales bacterium]|nr:MauE/DoxX family redox-associated membrane protein [Candidatus Limnocylindrales bacterium]
MTPLVEFAAAWIAVSLAADGMRKLSDVEAFVRWLRSGELTWAARREVVFLLGLLEVGVGIASVHPAGRMLAIGVIVAVTPLGAVLVKRTGVCACRGVVRSNTARNLVVRNASVVAAAVVTLIALDAPVALPAVLAAGSAWLIVLIGQYLLLTRTPVAPVRGLS